MLYLSNAPLSKTDFRNNAPNVQFGIMTLRNNTESGNPKTSYTHKEFKPVQETVYTARLL